LLSGIRQFIRRSLALPSAGWPFVRGDHTVISATAPVVVATSSPSAMPKALAAHPPEGLSMVSVLHTADDAADLLRALAANLATQSVICVESETAERPLGAALLKLGCGDEAPTGAVGTLMNAIASQIDSADLGALRRRVEFIDMLSCRETPRVVARIEKARAAAAQPNAGFVTQTTSSGVPRVILPRDTRYESRADKAGRFKISLEEQSIAVEHLNGKEDRLLRVIEGKTARDVCLALIRNGWVSKLDHAAYLGRELARAELALRSGRPFTQDSAEPADAAPPSVPDR
jgi:tetrahydromethanopterin S-methyltransferase subunit A